MDLFARVLSRSRFAHLAVAVFVMCSSSTLAHHASAQSAVPAAVTADNNETVAIEKGLELERNRLWADAVRHYETASRDFPNSKTLYQRLVISRIHYDVNRRFRDDSYVQAVQEMSANQALDLYSEILVNLEAHYVENVDWSRVQVHGTAALEVALTEGSFVNLLLADADAEAIENFRLTIHHKLKNRSTATRFDLRANVAFVAEVAQSELGLSGTATVLEYL
ncbi:MAG: S41 family peptidase, partial [Pirellulales bacterium]|nr:S41 family peptidase [Pirellulales bacterium]